MESVKLSYLLEHLKRVVAFNYQDPLWVVAEIAQISLNKGNYYISLVEKEEAQEQIKAKAEAVLWKSKYDARQALIYQQILKEGNKVLLKCQPEFHSIYGFKLSIVEVDPDYTAGLLLLEIEKTRTLLKEKGLWQLNTRLRLPAVIKRIAVISSTQAAGLQDFIEQINGNNYAYAFKMDLFDASVQGQAAELEIANAFLAIDKTAPPYDCIVLVRGGGAKLDLNVFNNFEVCKAICTSSVPVLTGIGHDINATIADENARIALKTPTAVAEFIISHNMLFESRCLEIQTNIRNIIGQRIHQIALLQQKVAFEITYKIDQILKYKSFDLEIIEKAIGNEVKQILLRKEKDLLRYQEVLLQYDWLSVVKKGYFVIEKSSKRLTAIADLQNNDKVVIIGVDGKKEFTLSQS